MQPRFPPRIPPHPPPTHPLWLCIPPALLIMYTQTVLINANPVRMYLHIPWDHEEDIPWANAYNYTSRKTVILQKLCPKYLRGVPRLPPTVLVFLHTSLCCLLCTPCCASCYACSCTPPLPMNTPFVLVETFPVAYGLCLCEDVQVQGVVSCIHPQPHGIVVEHTV
jgi:hypothetical protein